MSMIYWIALIGSQHAIRLGIAREPVSTRIKKTYKKDYSKIVQNYFELLELEKNTNQQLFRNSQDFIWRLGYWF